MRAPERIALVALALACAAAPAPAAEESPAARLDAVEEQIDAGEARRQALEADAAALERELRTMRARLVEAGRRTLELERRLSELEAELGELKAEETAKRQALAARRAELTAALAAAERLALFPPEAAMAAPGGPDDAVRSAIVLRTMVPAIEARMRAVVADLEALEAVRRDIAQRRAAVELAATELADERSATAVLLERKAALFARTDAERREADERVETLAAQAEDLRALIDRLEAQRKAVEEAAAARAAAERAEAERAAAERAEAERAEPAQTAAAPPAPARVDPVARPEAVRPIAGARGRLTVPVAGALVQRFGQNTAHFGGYDRGLVFDTRPGAQVVAPYDGRVAFAGPFRGYGLILIIDHGEGYHSLLIGLDRIDTTVNQWLLAGEPVGTVGRRTGGRSALYLELRERGQPIDPLPWLALTHSEASG